MTWREPVAAAPATLRARECASDSAPSFELVWRARSRPIANDVLRLWAKSNKLLPPSKATRPPINPMVTSRAMPAGEPNPTFQERLHTRHDSELGWVSRPKVFAPDLYGPGVYLRTNAQVLPERSRHPV